MAVSWSKQKNVSEVAAKLRTDLGLGTAALADTDDFATAADLTAAIDGLDSSFNAKVDVSRQVIAGRGLTGAGSLAADRIISADIADAAALSAGSHDKLVDAAALKSALESFQEIGGNSPNLVIFSTSGSYSKPSNLKWAEITVIGGGGGWGNYNSSNIGGAGGGTAIKKVKAADLAASNAVVIGAGGALNTNGGNSSITLPGGTITGGGGGSGYSAGYISTGGIGSGGNRNFKGSNGASNVVGASSFDLNVTDLAAANWGYGHGGSSSNAAKAGVVIIEEHF